MRADRTALQFWIRQQGRFAEVVALDQRVADLTGELLDVSRRQPGDAAALRDVLAQPRLRAIVTPLVAEGQDWGWAVVDPGGLVLARAVDEHVGARAGSTLVDAIGRVLAGNVVFVPPTTHQPFSAQPQAFILAGIRDAKGVPAAALVLHVPSEQLARILNVARSGETGETYAVDSAGVMLSESSFSRRRVETGTSPGGSQRKNERDSGGAGSRAEPGKRGRGGRPAARPAADRRRRLGLGRTRGEQRGRLSQLPRRARRGRLDLAAGLRDRADLRDQPERGLRRPLRHSPRVLDSHRRPRTRRARRRARDEPGTQARERSAAHPPAGPVHARREDRRGRHGLGLSRPARAAASADGNQAPARVARGHGRRARPVRAGGPADEPAHAPEHGRDLRLRPHAGRRLLLRDGVPCRASRSTG